tara:strand:- start:429 stop:545 length:117 start_codon:yes stop_codon:yes gene_type:complete
MVLGDTIEETRLFLNNVTDNEYNYDDVKFMLDNNMLDF